MLKSRKIKMCTVKMINQGPAQVAQHRVSERKCVKKLVVKLTR